MRPAAGEEESQERHAIGASFRDPAGFIFREAGVLYRQINPPYLPTYERLMSCGLADELMSRRFLVPHQDVTEILPGTPGTRIIKPEVVPFISYPHEWCFSELKAAALLTLAIQQRALESGFSLKDASAFNVQFIDGSPIFIDTLSFESANEERPWVAYRQFCQHFLAPLALMAHTDVRMNQLLRVYLDGIPLDLASRLLPGRTKLSPALLMHVHLHAGAQRKFAGRSSPSSGRMPKGALRGVIESLRATVAKLEWKAAGTEWADYYHDTNYSTTAMADKERLVNALLDEARPATVWDLGANVGRFSRLASRRRIATVAFDVDPAAVERNYLEVRKSKETHLLPLLSDLTNPSSAAGWAGEERQSLEARGKADTAMALALVHHLAIGNNVPLGNIAAWFARIARSIIVEFVPKSDSQVQRMLASRQDVFEDYTQQGFERALERHFIISTRQPVAATGRVLYLAKSR